MPKGHRKQKGQSETVTPASHEVTGNQAHPALVFNVPAKTYRQLEKRAAAEGITLDELARRALKNLLLRRPPGQGLN
jgi:hypothetical protein